MSRSVAWRHTSPEKVKERVELASTARLYILHQTGPTGFHIKEEGKERKLKVFLGDPHSCSCNVFMNERELCVHILWLLIRKFKLKREDPLVHQRGLIEREINELVLRELEEKKRTLSQETDRSTSSSVPSKQKEVQEGDVCPICQEDLSISSDPLTYCRQSCGKSLHVRCMKMWADHQKSLGEIKMKCPLCREDFGAYENLQKESFEAKKQTYKHSRAPNVHTGCVCCRCHTDPIVGVCYRCRECENYFLCSKCYIVDSHNPSHAFQARRYLSQKWKRADALKAIPSLPPNLAHTIENKELSSEDYDLLLQLDSTPDPSRGVAEHILFKFPIQPIKATSSLLLENSSCEICSEVYRIGDWVRKLPNCSHQFHRDCIDYKLRYLQTICPIDGIDVYPKRKKLKSHSATLPPQELPKSLKPGCLVTGPLLGLGSLPNIVTREGEKIEMLVAGEQMVRANQIGLESVHSRRPLPSAPSTQNVQSRNRAPLSLLNCKPLFSQQQPPQPPPPQQHSPIKLPTLARTRSHPQKLHPSNPSPDVKRNRKRTESEREEKQTQIQQLYIGCQALQPALNQNTVTRPIPRLRQVNLRSSRRRSTPRLELEVTTVPCMVRKDDID